jgi:hypothetical protein
MQTILRFAALRPISSRGSVLTLSTDSMLQRTLVGAGSDPGHREAIARGFAETDFLHEAGEVPQGAALVAMLARFRDAAPATDAKLREAVRAATDGADTGALNDALDRARDSVLAAYLLPDGPDATVAQDLVRALTLAVAVLSGSLGVGQLPAVLKGAVALPGFLERRGNGSAEPPERPEDVARELGKEINALAARHDALSAAFQELGLHAEDELEIVEDGARKPLSDQYLLLPAGASPRPPLDELRRKPPAEAIAASLPLSPMFRASEGRNLLLSPQAVSLLPEAVVGTLRDLDLDPGNASVAEMHASLLDARNQTGQQLMTLSGTLSDLAVGYKLKPIAIDPRWILDSVDAPEAAPPVAKAPPATHTDVRPLGIADLLLVRAHVARYERGEVAAIENVLPREKLTHTVRRLDVSETTTSEETEVTDLRSQTQTVAEQENGRTSVQAVGPGVGPIAAEGASSFARNVTDLVSTSSTARRRNLATERRLREREDATEHLIDNAGQTEPLFGVYQWLDKIYEARTFRYDSRLLYDIIVPEPAALFREALARPRSGLPLPSRPAPFTVSPGDLSLYNWAYYATGHRATGVEAPPPDEVIVSEPFGKQAKDPFASDSPTNTLTLAEARSTRIPKGYKALSYRVAILASGYPAGTVCMSIGTKTVGISAASGLYFRSGPLNGERETIPVAIDVSSNGVEWGVSDVTAGVEIVCRATDELISAWQVKAHGQILEANRRRFDDYAEAVATRDATARLVLQGLPRARKRRIVHTEVKRAALAFLTGQGFGGFNATAIDIAGFPFPDVAATGALADYIRFFEQAVEWERLAYTFLPYFWGAQTSWVSKLLANEPDEGFAGFLNSGAARVVLPIRPGYEAPFERFLRTGGLPTTNELLDAGSELWVSLVDELRSQDAAEDEEEPVGDAWHFRIATDLLRARTDGSMPKWTFAAGGWQGAPDPAF